MSVLGALRSRLALCIKSHTHTAVLTRASQSSSGNVSKRRHRRRRREVEDSTITYTSVRNRNYIRAIAERDALSWPRRHERDSIREHSPGNLGMTPSSRPLFQVRPGKRPKPHGHNGAKMSSMNSMKLKSIFPDSSRSKTSPFAHDAG